MKKPILTLLVASTLLTGLIHLHAQNSLVTYQGRVTSGGTNFTGSGQFKFSLVTSSNASATATAQANLTGTFVTSYTVISGGSGYLMPPTVTVVGGAGSGATATANLTGGVVTSITPVTAGSGYIMQPSVIIAAPPENIVYTTYWNNDGTFGMNNNEPGSWVTIPVSDGLFTARLGDTANMAALGAGLFQQQPNLKLRIWFSDGVNNFAELTPPQPLTAAPYALAATSASNLLGSLPASQVTGQLTGAQIANGAISAAKVDSTQVQLRITGAAPVGSFLTGIEANGNVSVAADSTDWKLGGNADTTAGTHFLGTTDNQRLEFKVNNQRALRIEPATNVSYGYSPNMIGGNPNNVASNGIIGAVIGGGGWDPSPNVVGNDFATVVGGFLNTASGFNSTAMGAGANASGASSTAMGNGTTASGNFSTAMGYSTTASGFWATAMGASTTASGSYSTTMGEQTTASGSHSTAMGELTTAGGSRSTAVGYRAKALHAGSYVWGDSISADIASTNDNSVTMRASGGYRLLSADASVGTGVFLASGGGSWISMSDRNAKENFEPVNSLAVLDKVMAMPLSTWNYKSQSRDTRHIGPMAQDFKAAFGVGEIDTGITTVDADGVALAAIQGLNQKLEATEKRVQEKEDKISALEERLRNLEKLVNHLD